MARPDSVAIGGYFKTPTHLIPRIAPLLDRHVEGTEVTFIDPCAGDGETILGIIKALAPIPNAHLYACEMEASRSVALAKACREISYHLGLHLVHGDAFNITFKRAPKDGASVLFLNPPYDLDRAFGRLEHKFLVRFTPTLMRDGILLFVVPHYALVASAEYLATEYANVHCFKFPDEDFTTFKQVVLFAQKGPTLHGPDSNILAQVQAYAKDASTLPELPNITSKPLARIPSSAQYREGLNEWALRAVDFSGLLAKARPWTQNAKGGAVIPVPGILPDLPVEELLLRTYPVATPPRPAHIAAGIAAGVFNGARVEPTDPKSHLPPLLVKGVFDQEYRTVDEKVNKDGDVSLVQVQQPKLVATVLDLETHRYHVLGSGSSTEAKIGSLTVAGLLEHYGDSLMAVMERQCPILYDPRKDGDKVTLAQTKRVPYTAQAHSAKALVMLLGGDGIPLRKRRGKGAWLLGEIGSGKTTVALVVSKTIGAKRPLVVCPPHLLTSWSNEIASVLPEAEVRILDTIADVEAVTNDPRDGMIVSVVSRETAKLSHGWLDVGQVCPECGRPVQSDGDQARKRLRCEHRELVGEGPLTSLVLKLCGQLVRFAPKDPTISLLLRGRWDRKRIDHYSDKEPIAFPGFIPSYFDTAIDAVLEGDLDREHAKTALVWMLLCINDENKIVETAERLLVHQHWEAKALGRNLLLLLKPNSPRQVERVEHHRKTNMVGWGNPWDSFPRSVESAQRGESDSRVADLPVSWAEGQLVVGGAAPRSIEAARGALNALTHLSGLRWSGKKCQAFLYQACPEPRRMALAEYIFHKQPKTFDFLVLDEAHEYGTDGSAQERSAHRLTGLGLPTIKMTGTVMNGYAESLFMNMWHLSPAFRVEFDRDDKQRFNDRYGYRKRIISADEVVPKVVEFGAVSDRVVSGGGRIIGNAPGVMPLFILRHLLPIAVTLHKADLALDLPLCKQERIPVEPGPELSAKYQMLVEQLVTQIKKDRFDENLAGKLFGQLAEIPSYLDRATEDTGNTEQGSYEIRYPESVGGKLVTMQDPLPAATILPKEQWLIDDIRNELAEGRNVMVLSWHVNVLPRLARLISEALDGERVPILYANKVQTAKRQDWITNQVVKRGARVMVTNPVAIQTGLNNLVHFATELWMENPACNPITFRQGSGRVDRIGQQLETRIKFPIYKGTLQEALYDLLMQKVAVSISTDGLDPESALLAAGVGSEEYLTGLSIGKHLWAMLSNSVASDPTPAAPKAKASKGAKAPAKVVESKPVSIFDLLGNDDTPSVVS